MWQRILASCKHVSSALLARPILSSASTIGRPGASLIRSTAVSTSSRQRWTPKEDQKLADLHAKGIALKEMIAMFPGRTFPAVSSRRDKLNLTTFKKQAPYSQTEDETLLRLKSECKPWTTILSALPQRSRVALEKRITQLLRKDTSLETGTIKPSRRKWTDEEEQKLRDFASQGLSWRKVAQLMPSRPLRSVESAARRMGLRTTRPSDRWTAEEDEKVIKGREAGMTFADICAKKLPDRSLRAITSRWISALQHHKR